MTGTIALVVVLMVLRLLSPAPYYTLTNDAMMLRCILNYIKVDLHEKLCRFFLNAYDKRVNRE